MFLREARYPSVTYPASSPIGTCSALRRAIQRPNTRVTFELATKVVLTAAPLCVHRLPRTKWIYL